jgi:NADPH2:quinone reductase
MTHAIRFHTPGGPEVLRWEEVGAGDTVLFARN